MTGFWQVSPAEVANIDRALLAFLRRQKLSEAAVLDREQYGRQYLGFFRGKRRYVFINAFPQLRGVIAQNAETEVIAVCDNGWGVQYDLGTQEFTNLGIDSGPPPHP